jgi:hypothetical protein
MHNHPLQFVLYTPVTVGKPALPYIGCFLLFAEFQGLVKKIFVFFTQHKLLWSFFRDLQIAFITQNN